LTEDEVLAAVSDPSEWETGWTGSDYSKHPMVSWQVLPGTVAAAYSGQRRLCMFVMSALTLCSVKAPLSHPHLRTNCLPHTLQVLQQLRTVFSNSVACIH
jgi:hypothetical protein